jgi:hypothetical protein
MTICDNQSRRATQGPAAPTRRRGDVIALLRGARLAGARQRSRVPQRRHHPRLAIRSNTDRSTMLFDGDGCGRPRTSDKSPGPLPGGLSWRSAPARRGRAAGRPLADRAGRRLRAMRLSAISDAAQNAKVAAMMRCRECYDDRAGRRIAPTSIARRSIPRLTRPQAPTTKGPRRNHEIAPPES